MKTLKEFKAENRNYGRKGRYFIPFRVFFNNSEELKNFLGDSFTLEIEKAFNIAREAGAMTTRKKKELIDLGFRLFFRGFNSHSGDVFIYQDSSNRWFLSIGISNVNQAGRGYEIEL